MIFFSRKGYLLLLLLGVIGLVLNSCKDEFPEYGEGFVYMPQATQSGGVNNIYEVPSGNGELTYNIKLDSSSGNLVIDLGIIRSGSFNGDDFSVDITTDETSTKEFVESGVIMDAIAMPAKNFSLPSKVAVTGNKATFDLSINAAILLKDFTYVGKKLVLSVGLSNPTKYKLSSNGGLTMIVIDVNKVRDMFFRYKEGFLYRKGDQLMLNGKEYKGVGLNIPALNGCAANNELFSTQEMEKLFDSLPENSLVRIPAFKGYEEVTDQIIKSAEKHHIKLMLSLLEGDNEGCGNFGKSKEFYEDGYRDEFLDYVKTMTDKYKNSPAIGIWEITTKPSNWIGLTFEILKKFYNEVGKTIKSADPNHLVATGLGNEFTVGPSQQSQYYEAVHHSIYIDIGTFYDLDGGRVESWHFAAISKALKDLNKPFIITGIKFSASDVPGCQFDYNGRTKMFEDKVDFYLGKDVNIIFTPPFVNNDLDQCNVNFDPQDPLYGACIGFLNKYLK